jgi:hypothetical protein
MKNLVERLIEAPAINSGMDRALTRRQRIGFRTVEIARHSKMEFAMAHFSGSSCNLASYPPTCSLLLSWSFPSGETIIVRYDYLSALDIPVMDLYQRVPLLSRETGRSCTKEATRFSTNWRAARFPLD